MYVVICMTLNKTLFIYLWPMNAFSHVYTVCDEKSIETLIRMKWDWQTDTMYIHAPVFCNNGLTMLVTFSIKKQVYQCTTIMQCSPIIYDLAFIKSNFNVFMLIFSFFFIRTIMQWCMPPFLKQINLKKVQVINEWKLGLTFYSVISIN